MKRTIYYLILTLVLVTSCKKDTEKDPEPSPSVNAQLLQSHGWKYNPDFYLVFNGQLAPYALPECLLDDKLEYAGSDRYIKDSGAELCPGQAQKDTLTWTLIENDTKLRIVNKTVTIDKDILTLKNDSLITREINQNGDTTVFIYLKY